MAAEAANAAIAAAIDDVVGSGEEEFDTGIRQNEMERDAADLDQDRRLDLAEFSTFLRDREDGDIGDDEIAERFAALDKDDNGRIDTAEYLQWSLKDALARSSTRVIDLFRSWDDDKSGNVDKREFYTAISALLGSSATRATCDAVFDSLDDNRSGRLEYAELNEMLRKNSAANQTKRNLKRIEQADRSRTGKLTAKNVNVNYMTSRTAALPDTVKLDTSGDISVQEQLVTILKEHQVKLIDLFREWDVDGNGAIDKKEFRRGVAALGYDAPRKEVDALFDSMDVDSASGSSGFIEYDEFKKALSARNVEMVRRELDAAARAAGKETPSERRKMNEPIPEPAAASPRRAPTAAQLEAEQAMREAEEAQRAREAVISALPEQTQADMRLLRDFLAKRNVQCMALFREWDADHNGVLDKKEFRRAVYHLGFSHAGAECADALFFTMDNTNDGLVDFGEMKRSLNSWLKGQDAPQPRRASLTGTISRSGSATKTRPTSAKSERCATGCGLATPARVCSS